MNYRSPVKLRLKELMNENGVSVEELAKEIHATEGEIIDWMNRRKTPPTKKVALMTRYFHCSSDYLLGLDNNRNYYDEDEDNEYEDYQEKPRSFLPRLIKFVLIAGAAFIVFGVIMANL